MNKYMNIDAWSSSILSSRGIYRVHPGTLRLVARPLEPVRSCHFHRQR